MSQEGEEMSERKEPPNRSINRTREPTPRYPFTHSAPLNSVLGSQIKLLRELAESLSIIQTYLGRFLMPKRKQSKGSCTYCALEMSRTGMTKHLSACPQRQQLITQTDLKKNPDIPLYHLVVKDAWQGDFWLHLEIRGTATLDDLDHYLRAIWLECCGHLSQFSVGGWRGREISMNQSIKAVFQSGVELTHIYDFGTSSETLIRVAEKRQGKPTTPYPIALMARNTMPEVKCIECERVATWFCNECFIADDVWGTLCDEHAKTHPHDDYGEPIALVNSPRLGMCGYEGPADAPY